MDDISRQIMEGYIDYIPLYRFFFSMYDVCGMYLYISLSIYTFIHMHPPIDNRSNLICVYIFDTSALCPPAEVIKRKVCGAAMEPLGEGKIGDLPWWIIFVRMIIIYRRIFIYNQFSKWVMSSWWTIRGWLWWAGLVMIVATTWRGSIKGQQGR